MEKRRCDTPIPGENEYFKIGCLRKFLDQIKAQSVKYIHQGVKPNINNEAWENYFTELGKYYRVPEQIVDYFIEEFVNAKRSFKDLLHFVSIVNRPDEIESFYVQVMNKDKNSEKAMTRAFNGTSAEEKRRHAIESDYFGLDEIERIACFLIMGKITNEEIQFIRRVLNTKNIDEKIFWPECARLSTSLVTALAGRREVYMDILKKTGQLEYYGNDKIFRWVMEDLIIFYRFLKYLADKAAFVGVENEGEKNPVALPPYWRKITPDKTEPSRNQVCAFLDLVKQINIEDEIEEVVRMVEQGLASPSSDDLPAAKIQQIAKEHSRKDK